MAVQNPVLLQHQSVFVKWISEAVCTTTPTTSYPRQQVSSLCSLNCHGQHQQTPATTSIFNNNTLKSSGWRNMGTIYTSETLGEKKNLEEYA